MSDGLRSKEYITELKTAIQAEKESRTTQIGDLQQHVTKEMEQKGRQLQEQFTKELQVKEQILVHQIMTTREQSVDQMTAMQQDFMTRFDSIQKTIEQLGAQISRQQRPPDPQPSQSSNGLLGHGPASTSQVHESFTSGPSHAVNITREAIREGADAVIAVGGDGTLHEVVNGFFWAGKPVYALDKGSKCVTTLGLIPLGTGSDFARTYGWKNDPHEATERIAKGLSSKIDIGCITGSSGEHHYFINVADIHLSAKAGYYSSMYKSFGNLCYVLGALRAFIGHHNLDLKIKVDEKDWKVYDKVTALCIGNGKFFGGGMKIVPNADPSSGNMEVVILQDFNWYDFVFKLYKLYNGSHLSEQNVESKSLKSIEVAMVEGKDIYVQSDGEHLGFLPMKCSVLPGVIDFFV